MTFQQPWIMWALALVATLDVAATIEIYLDPFLEQHERLKPLAFIWLVPVLGAVISLSRAWRVHQGLDRKPDPEAVVDAADLVGIPVVSRSRANRDSDDSWAGGDAD